MLPPELGTLAHWNLPEPATVSRPDGGTNNTVWILDDSYVLRIYDNIDIYDVLAEHRLLTALSMRGALPFVVPVPLPARDGRTVVETADGRSAALFGYVPGGTARREDVVSIELAAEALGVVDDALARLPAELALRDGRGPLDRLHPAVEDLEGLGAELERQLPGDDGVAWFRAHIRSTDRRYRKLLDTLPTQLIHGDFSLTNVIVDDGKVRAVLDFDHAYLGLRAEDPVAAMLMAAGFGSAGENQRLEAFRRGYARTARLETGEEHAVPTLLRRRGLGGIVWWSGRWRRGLANIEQVQEKLDEGVQIERWLARSTVNPLHTAR